jgi:hypothetical protein
MEKNIIVSVTNKAYKNATSFSDIYKCPLATAIRFMFPKAEILVGGATVTIKENRVQNEYRINGWSENNRFDEDKFANMITTRISKAKQGIRQATTKVTLKLIHSYQW